MSALPTLHRQRAEIRARPRSARQDAVLLALADDIMKSLRVANDGTLHGSANENLWSNVRGIHPLYKPFFRVFILTRMSVLGYSSVHMHVMEQWLE